MEIDTGNYGAYMIENPKEPLYVVQWEGIPWKATLDGFEILNGDKYAWTQGDWMCRGAWLQKLKGGDRNWYTMDTASQSCIVNLEKVVNANIDMRPFTEKEWENPLPSKVNHKIALRRGA